MDESNGHTRRNFLRTAGGAAATAVGLGVMGGLAPTASAATGNLMPVQGRHIPNNKIGLQLYSVRNAFMSQPEAVLRALAADGYSEVEFAGFPGGTDPEHARALRPILDKYGLTAISSHHNFSEFVDQNRLNELIEMAKILGQKYIVCPGGVPYSADGFAKAGAAFNKAGEQIRRAGMICGYHNHTGEFENHGPDGRTFYQILLDNSDPHLLCMELDMGWASHAGLSEQEIIDLMAANKGRMLLSHVKDLYPDGSLADVGKGVIDYQKILSVAGRLGMRQYIIENDDQSNPLTDSRADYMHDYVATLKL